MKLLLKCGCFLFFFRFPRKDFHLPIASLDFEVLKFSRGELVSHYLDVSGAECKLIFNSFSTFSSSPEKATFHPNWQLSSGGGICGCELQINGQI